MFTTTLNLKTYLVNLSYRERGIMAKFRCRNHNLPIESGCRQNIPRNLRICELCTQDIGDEFHYIFNCSHFEVIRKELLNKRPRGLDVCQQHCKKSAINVSGNVYLYSKMHYHEKMYILYIDHWHFYYYIIPIIHFADFTHVLKHCT